MSEQARGPGSPHGLSGVGEGFNVQRGGPVSPTILSEWDVVLQRLRVLQAEGWPIQVSNLKEKAMSHDEDDDDQMRKLIELDTFVNILADQDDAGVGSRQRALLTRYRTEWKALVEWLQEVDPKADEFEAGESTGDKEDDDG